MRKLTLIAAVTIAAQCSPAAASAQTAVAGFGSDDRPPSGSPLQLPAGLQIAGPLMGANDDGDCPKPSAQPVGSGLDVRACLPVRNMTGGPVTVIFPPGLTLVSQSETFQNGVLVEREVITVPPVLPGPGRLRDEEEDDDVFYIPLHMYCINPAKDPSDATATFALGPVTTHPGMGAIYSLLEDRDISNDRDPVEAVQRAVHDIARTGEISEDSREALQEYVIDR